MRNRSGKEAQHKHYSLELPTEEGLVSRPNESRTIFYYVRYLSNRERILHGVTYTCINKTG